MIDTQSLLPNRINRQIVTHPSNWFSYGASHSLSVSCPIRNMALKDKLPPSVSRQLFFFYYLFYL